MAKLKSAYRKVDVIEQPDRPVVVAPVEPQAEAEAKTDTPAVEPKTEIEYRAEVSKADEAAMRLKRQLADLAMSEQLNRQAAQMAQHVPLTREQKLDLWRQKGMPDDQAEFLRANPELIDHSDLAAYAANEAAQSHERGSAEHMHATKDLFDRHMERLKQQAEANGHSANPRPTPQFFEPPPAPRPPQPPTKAQLVSAPVSRNGGPSGDYGTALPTDPSKVRLSAEEVQIAKASNISTTEYARQKLRMLEAKARGEII